MKNSVLLTIALCATLFTNAQDQQWKIGFKLNPNVSWMKPDNKSMTNEGNNLRLGFSLMIDKMFTENYAFGTGLNIFTTGAQLSYLRKTNEQIIIPGRTTNSFDVISQIDRTYKLQYGEIPFTLKMRTNEIGYITYWGQFGLGLGFNIRAKSDDVIDYQWQNSGDANENGNIEDSEVALWRESTLESTSVEDEDIKDDIKLFRTSLIIGAGIEYSLSGSTAIIAGLTYNNGFSNALNDDGVEKNDKDTPVFQGSSTSVIPKTYRLKAYTNFIELNVGILF